MKRGKEKIKIMFEENIFNKAKKIFAYIKDDLPNININTYRLIYEKIEEIDNNRYNQEFSISKIKPLVLSNNNKKYHFEQPSYSEISTNFITNEYNEENESEEENYDCYNENDDIIDDIAYSIFNNIFLNPNSGIVTESEITSFLQELKKCFS